MKKEKILKTAGTIGKCAVRIAVCTGVNVAIMGAGILGTVLVASGQKNKVASGLVLGLGGLGSFMASHYLGSYVDERIVEEYNLEV